MTVDPGSRGWNEHRHRWDVPAGTIQTADIADGSVTTPKLANLAVTAAKIANGAVGTTQVANNAITTALLANAAVGTAQIVGGAITAALLATGAVGTTQLAANAATNVNWYAAAASNSTTSLTGVAISGVTISLTTVGGPVFVVFSTPLLNSVAGAGNYLFLRVDAGVWQTVVFFNTKGASQTDMVAGVYVFNGLSAASHTFDMGWQTTTGTLSQNGAALTTMLVVELRR